MCDTLVAVRPGRVLFGKNSDRHPNEAQYLDWRPFQVHPEGTRLLCTRIEIDQVAETNAVLLSRPFWMWGAEMGTNEHGVTIGNEAVFTDQPYAATGLTGMDLVRLALERAATAETAVGCTIDLLDRHGQGGGCGHEDPGLTYHNSFLVADPNSAFVLETAGGLWATEPVTSGVRSISNGLTIPGFVHHGARMATWGTQARKRRAIADACPADSAGDVVAVLRAHGRHGPVARWAPFMGAKAAPCMHAGGGRMATSQTTASWVAELRPDGAVQHWVTGTAAPCTGLFKPVRVDQPIDLGPDPTDTFDGSTIWWRHEVLHRTVQRDPDRLLAVYRAERDGVEARWLAAPPDPASAFAEAEALTDAWVGAVLSAGGADRRPRRLRHYWDLRDGRSGMPKVSVATGDG